MSNRLLDVSDIAALLAAQIVPLARTLLPEGRRQGNEWVTGSNRSRSNFSVHLAGGKAGVWKDFAADIGGDALDLVAYVRGHGKGDAIRWARQYLGLDSPDPAVLAQARERAHAHQDRADEQAKAERDRKRRNAQAMWLSAQEQISGTPVDAYLRGRGIALEELRRAPRALRFHPALHHGPSGRAWPAMLAAVTDLEGRHVCTHQTWLEVLRDGRVTKAPLGKQAKMVLGGYSGACIRLARGDGPKRLADAAPGEIIDITEGIEDGLSVALSLPGARVVSALSLSNIGKVALPPAITTVRLWCQRDHSNAALLAADRAVRAHQAAGRSVLIPPLAEGCKDVNDMLRAG